MGVTSAGCVMLIFRNRSQCGAGPTFLNVLRFLDVPQAVAMASVRSRVRLYQPDKTGWDFPREIAKRHAGKDALQIRVQSAKSR